MKKNNSESIYKTIALIVSFVDLILILYLVSMTGTNEVMSNNNIIDNENKDNNVVEGIIEEDIMNNEKMEGNIVLFETSEGNFKVELFVEKSPITAGNFKQLVESGFYDGIKFHRVIDGFMIQGGDPLSKNDSLKNRWGSGGSEPIEDEFISGLSNVKGSLSMANAGPNTGSSQFFINVADNTFLDWDKAPAQSKHPVFGKIVEGMDVIEKISKVKTTGQPYDRPVNDVVIIKASIIEN